MNQIVPEKTIIQKESCTTMFIAAVFTIARTWKQPKCPSTDEWIKKMWHICAMEHYSAIKRNELSYFSVLCDHLEGWDREGGRETQEGGDMGIYVYV